MNRLLLAAALYLVTLTSRAGEEELIAPEVFFAPARIGSVAITPDGSRIAALRQFAQHAEIHIYAVGEDNKVRAETGFAASDRVTQVMWLTSKHLGILSEERLTARYNGTYFGLPGGIRILYTYEPPEGEPIEIHTTSGSDFPVVARESDSDHHLLIHNDDRAYGIRDLVKIDLRDGSSKLVAKGNKKTRNYIQHPDEGSILRLDQTPKKIEILQLKPGTTNKWKVLQRLKGKSAGAEFTNAMRSFYGQTRILVREREDDEEYHQLFEYNLLDPNYREPAVRMDGYDIIETIRVPFTGSVIGFTYLTHRLQHEYFAELLQFAHAEMDYRYPNGENIFIDGSSDYRYFIFKTTEPSDPGEFVLFDGTRNEITRLGTLNPELARHTSRVERIEYKTDGRTLSGFLTLPPDARKRPLPLIVYARSHPEQVLGIGYQPDVQLFASRGFAVWQANVRGTSGFGRSLWEAGHGQFATGAIADLDAGIRALANIGRVDSERVCVLGRRFGGYTALLLATRPNGVKCVAVDQPIFNLLEGMQGSSENADQEHAKLLTRRFGIADELSPLAHIEKLRLPVLNLHTGLPDSNQEQFSKLMKAAANPFIERTDVRGAIQTSKAMLDFFQAHIGSTDAETKSKDLQGIP